MIKSRRLGWVGHEPGKEEGRSPFKMLTDEPTGKRLSGRPRRRWKENIRMDFKEIGTIRGIGLFGSGLGLLESSCVCGFEPPGSIIHVVS